MQENEPKKRLSRIFNKEVVTSLSRNELVTSLRTGIKSAKLGMDVVTLIAKASALSLIAPAAVATASGAGALVAGVLLATLAIKKASQPEGTPSPAVARLRNAFERVTRKAEETRLRITAPRLNPVGVFA